MLRIKRILFPTDFSECAEHAFSQAAHLAEKFEAELHVLNVVVPRAKDPDNPMNYLEQVDFSVPFDAVAGGRAEGELRVIHDQETSYSEATGILDYADRHHIDLIVMGTHGRRGLGRMLLGSVAEEIVRLASGPVLTVCSKAEAGGNKPIRRILAPVDFSDSTRSALAHAGELAAAYDAHLDLLHVITDVTLPGVYGVQSVSIATPEVKMRVRQALRDEMEAAGSGISYDVHVVVGVPARDIVDFAAQQGTDLIVIATHGRTGLRRLVMGSVAENVVRQALCPVFTCKSFGRSLLEDEPPSSRQAAGEAPSVPS
ncbi:MAG: universal stress protein [Rhodothermales bacterium]